MAHSAQKGKIIAVIGDEDTVVGFLLGGIGELNKVSFIFIYEKLFHINVWFIDKGKD